MSDKPMPPIEPRTRDFWDACARDVLSLQTCRSCGAVQFYPRLVCTGCGGTDLMLEASSGKGVIKSYTVCRVPVSAAFADDVPYAIALIALEEGPTLMSNVIECDVDQLAIGMPVEVLFEPRGDLQLPMFKPAQ